MTNNKSNCERCHKYFSNDELNMFNKELLCLDCIDEIKHEEGSPWDL